MWARVAECGKVLGGIGSCVVCVDCMVVWSGSWTVMGFVVLVSFSAGVSCVRKCPVAPVSKINVVARFTVEVG